MGVLPLHHWSTQSFNPEKGNLCTESFQGQQLEGPSFGFLMI